MNNPPARIYSFLSGIYYENINRYEPTNEYYDAVRSILPQNWRVEKRSFWTMCEPDGWVYSNHGWKIHVSSVQENALETVRIVSEILKTKAVAFKFCSDPRMLRMSLGKTWSRFQTGKFFAVYPRNEEEFKSVIEALHGATKHLVGPHILTDRPYADSTVIYYRYGAHISERRVDSYGNRTSGFTLSDGSWYEDVRGPSFKLPPGFVDPFTTEQPLSAAAPVLLNNRYLIKSAIKFNATGGIYLGIDNQTGREVVVREVRGRLGHLESQLPEDPTYSLKRQARILKKLSPTGLVPEYFDLFQEWNNWFLVEEKLNAQSLWGTSMEFYYSSEYQTSSFGLGKLLGTIEKIAQGLRIIHSNGVVLRDLTRNNIMFTNSGEVKFIDLEFAYETDVGGPWVNGWTPGYASREQMAFERPTVKDDCYALGALILDVITYCAGGLELDREVIVDKKLKQVLSDLHLPIELHTVISGLICLDAEERWDIPRALACLSGISSFSDEMMFPLREDLLNIEKTDASLIRSIEDIEKDFNHYLDATLDLSRNDRLWPASPQVFETDPVSLQFGASGVAWYKLRSCGSVDAGVLDWIEEKSMSSFCPPGLFSGLGGSALLLLYAGRVNSAEKQMERIAADERTFTVPGLYFGCSGWGLANLHFWKVTGEKRYLGEAIKIGEWLLGHSNQGNKGIYWKTDGKAFLGLGDGQSGVALFLTYLAAASGDDRFLSAASSALDFDLSHGNRIAGRITWRTDVKATDAEPNFPHTRFGSAGVGSVCIRHFALSGESRFREAALDCAFSVRSRVTNKLWQDFGNAGLGEFLLDMSEFMKDERFRDIAYYQAEAIVPHAITLPEGRAFAGFDHQRICNDYCSGGAGIGIFFDRLVHNKRRFLMLDELIK